MRVKFNKFSNLKQQRNHDLSTRLITKLYATTFLVSTDRYVRVLKILTTRKMVPPGGL